MTVAVLEAGARRALLKWFDANRRDLPWRPARPGARRDPYAVWVSEIMLQQTRVDTVVPYFTRFMDRFPTVRTLADAPRDEVLAAWSGLGYYRRARLLHDGARDVEDHHGGGVPSNPDALAGVPGVGPYTAGAILSLAFGQPAALVDGTVARVFSRWFVLADGGTKGRALTWELARAHVAVEADPARWNEALMELGATVCLPRSPRCGACPVSAHCAARAGGVEELHPRKVPRASVPTERLQALVARLRGRVLLGRRAEDARFGGLWEPPVVPAAGGTGAAGRNLSAAVGAPVTALEVAGTVTHVLTHRRLTARVFRGVVASRPLRARHPYEKWMWVDVRRLADVGVSTFARKLIERAS